MSEINKDTLAYLGFDFQHRLINQLIVDRRFGASIIDMVEPNYFKDEYLKVIVATIKDAHEMHETIPDMGSLESRLLESVNDDVRRKYVIINLRKIQEVETNDILWVQEVALNFCKQQELKKSLKEIHILIEKGEVSKYPQCEDILRKALDKGVTHDDTTNVVDNIDLVLSDDFRNPIPTGISGLDEIMNGGLAKGELGVILAPFGVGKTTMITKMANTAKNLGKNVLQIFFEDMPKVIQRKHLACWSGYELNSLGLYKEELKDIVKKKTEESGILKLKKFPSVGTNVPMLKQYIRKQIAQGFRPDIIFIDYVDCLEPSKRIDDANVAEGHVMRELESLLSELDLAGWTAVQGNRSSIGAEIVQAHQMGGSIKKGQIGHFIVSIAKTLEQKTNNTATMAILKSRFGKDGYIYENIVFNNATIQIDMDKKQTPKTSVEYNDETTKAKSVDDQKLVNSLLSAQRVLKDSLIGIETKPEDINKDINEIVIDKNNNNDN